MGIPIPATPVTAPIKLPSEVTPPPPQPAPYTQVSQPHAYPVIHDTNHFTPAGSQVDMTGPLMDRSVTPEPTARVAHGQPVMAPPMG